MHCFPALRLGFVLSIAACGFSADLWTIRLEEPTGIYRRDQEVVRVPLEKLSGKRTGFLITDAQGRELPWQVADHELLFPASVVSGTLPKFQVACCQPPSTKAFSNGITLRKLGSRRVEFGNDRFRAVIDLDAAAIVEAYSLAATAHKALNLVETTPESPAALTQDIHASEAKKLEPISGVEGENTGWTTAGGTGPITNLEFVENGPLRGRIRLSRAGEEWEIVWTAHSGVFLWKARQGFLFRAVSASPYLPFDRCVDGNEEAWPDASSTEEPAEHDIQPRAWKKLPGGHIVYYRRAEDYGALGLVALDSELDWTGAGSRRFTAQKQAGETQIAVTFPRWKGFETELEARRENRIVRQPLLVQVSAKSSGDVQASRVSAQRDPDVQVEEITKAPTPVRPESISLDGDWELAFSEKGEPLPTAGWRTVQVPGSAHLQWLPRDQIYTRQAEWISSKVWWYRKKFRVPPALARKRIRLQFDATDYYADSYLNGRYLGRHEGYVDSYEYDVSGDIHNEGEQELLVRVWTPVTYYWRNRPYTVKGSYGAVDQKPDNITPLGITHSVRLVASGHATITDVAVNTVLVEKDAAVEVQLDAKGVEPGDRWQLTLSPRNFSSPQHYQATATAQKQSQISIPVHNPRLWWTWDHGKPNLYTLDVRLLDAKGNVLDSRSVAVGIREIEKVGWNFYLNRKRMFVRGTNYYDNLFLSEMNRAAYEKDIDLMLHMNVNMIRVHGHFTNQRFYDLADEKGVLLWQDFLEAWYPADRDFSLRAAALYDNHIRYARNHPSIAIWATSDEEGLENYRDLTKHLAPRLFFLDPQHRPAIRSTGRYGDSHLYYGWYEGSLWQYAKMMDPFVSEFGATALPNYESLVRFLPNAWPIEQHKAEWLWHKLQIPEAMKAWGSPGAMTLQEYIPKTQAYEARLFQIALERARRRKSEGTGGILHFHAIDLWPSITMSAIDFYRVPTKVFDTVRRSFEPVAALFEYDRDRWKPDQPFECGIWAANDQWDSIPKAAIRWQIVNREGEEFGKGLWPAPMSADSVAKIGTVQWNPAAPGAYELHAAVQDESGKIISENIFEFEIAP